MKNKITDKDIEKMLLRLGDSASFIDDDELAEFIKSKSKEKELSEDDLDLVAAASGIDYQKFLEIVKKKNHK